MKAIRFDKEYFSEFVIFLVVKNSLLKVFCLDVPFYAS